MVRLAVRAPPAPAPPQATSSFTVSSAPVNLAADSGAASVREVVVVDPETEAS